VLGSGPLLRQTKKEGSEPSCRPCFAGRRARWEVPRSTVVPVSVAFEVCSARALQADLGEVPPGGVVSAALRGALRCPCQALPLCDTVSGAG